VTPLPSASKGLEVDRVDSLDALVGIACAIAPIDAPIRLRSALASFETLPDARRSPTRTTPC